MSAFRRILVAVKDPRARAQPAIAKAARIALAGNGQLELFHAITTPIPIDPFAYPEEQVRDLKHAVHAKHLLALERQAAKLRKVGLRVKCVASWDYPAYESVIRHATRGRVDLVVADRHPTKHHGTWMLTYVDWELLRQSPVPVLIVKSAKRYRRPVVLAAVDPSQSHNKPTELNDRILRSAALLTELLAGKLHVVSSWLPVVGDLLPYKYIDEVASRRLEYLARQQAGKALEQAMKRSGVISRHRHVLAGQPADVILETANELHGDIVVMGAIARSGIKRLVIGNTAERVLDDLACDVLIVKPTTFKSSVPRKSAGPNLTPLMPVRAF